MTNLSEILKKYNCIPVCIDTKGGFILNVKGNYDEEELQRSFLFSDFVYTNDIPSLMNCFNDFATGSKKRLNTHFRMEFEKELHWAYLCCEKTDGNMVYDGVLLDVFEYMECIQYDNVVNDYERRQSKKISELNKNAASLEEIYGVDYLVKLQQPFLKCGIESAIFDDNGRIIASVSPDNADFSPEKFKYFKSEFIRFNYKNNGIWCIGTDDEESFNRFVPFLGLMCESLSKMTDSFILLYNEKQNSKSINRQLGTNVEQQMLLNGIHSIIMEEHQAENALSRVLETVGNYLHLDRISIYCKNPDDKAPCIVSEWKDKKYTLSLPDTYVRENYDSIGEILSGTENYFSRGSEEQLKALSLGVFAVSVIYGYNDEKAFLFYESYEKDKKWSYEEKRIIRSISQSISNIMHRCEMDRKIQEKNEQLSRLAFYDNNLCIKNRAKLDIDMKNILDNSGYGVVMAVHIVNTRSLNEVFGQGYTDRLLRLVVSYLGNEDVGGEFVYRYSGSIMLIVLNDCKPDYAQEIARRILDRFEQPFVIDNVEQYAEAAIGVAVFDESVKECEDLYRAVTLSLYRANEYGRNSYAFFNHEFRRSSGDVYNLEQELRRCIADGMRNFELTYQPVFAKDNTIHHYEALLRWKSDNAGFVSPRVFMRLMEKVGLDTAIDFWVIPKACKFCKRMQEKFGDDIRVSVNLTVHDLQGGSVSTVVANALSEAGLAPSSFIVEIPESAHLLAYNEASSTLGKLKRLGILICIDSFGNEYLPLNTLKFSYVDLIKVSSSFITNSGDKFDEELVKTTIYLAGSRNIEVIVKNIEHKAQLEAAYSYNLNILQGGFLSLPESADKYLG